MNAMYGCDLIQQWQAIDGWMSFQFGMLLRYCCSVCYRWDVLYDLIIKCYVIQIMIPQNNMGKQGQYCKICKMGIELDL